MSELILKGVVNLSNVRLSFPHIAAPQVQKGDDGTDKPPSYSAVFLMEPNHPGWAEFMRVVGEKAAEKWGARAPGVMQIVWGDNKKRAMGQGNEKIDRKTLLPYDGYGGMHYITAGKKVQPQIIDAQGRGVDPANSGQCRALAGAMYPGCYVNAAVQPWMQENKHGFGVRCELIAVQFLRDGQPFGEAIKDASAMFGATEAAAPAAAAPSTPPWMVPALLGQPAPATPGWTPPAGLPSFLS